MKVCKAQGRNGGLTFHKSSSACMGCVIAKLYVGVLYQADLGLATYTLYNVHWIVLLR